MFRSGCLLPHRGRPHNNVASEESLSTGKQAGHTPGTTGLSPKPVPCSPAKPSLLAVYKWWLALNQRGLIVAT